MSKVSFIFQAAKFLGVMGLPVILPGCALAFFFQRDYPCVLYIENKLTSEIAYCTDSAGEDCSNVISGGDSRPLVYISRGGKPSDERMDEAFDRETMKICGKLIDFKRIRSILPVMRRSSDRYEIIIDKAVSDAFCQ